MQLLPPQSIDPNVPAQIPADQLQDFKGFLDIVLDTVVGGAAPDVLTLGHQLWGGLAAIVVAWSGLKIAYSGTLEPWALGAQKFPLVASSRISLSTVRFATARFSRAFSFSSSLKRRA